MVAITQDQYSTNHEDLANRAGHNHGQHPTPHHTTKIRGWRKEGRLVSRRFSPKTQNHCSKSTTRWKPRHRIAKTLRQVARLYWWPEYGGLGNEVCEKIATVLPNNLPADCQNHLPIITSLRSKVHEAQETTPHCIEKMGPPALDQRRSDEERGDWQKEGAGDPPR